MGSLTPDKTLILVALVAFVVIINYSLFSALRKKKTPNEVKMFIDAGKSLRRPFEKEEKELADLAEAVRQLRDQGHLGESDDHA